MSLKLDHNCDSSFFSLFYCFRTSGSSSRGIMSLSTISKLLTVRFFCVSVESLHALGSQMTTMWYVLLHLENWSSLLPKLKAEKNVHRRDTLLNEGYGLTINTFFMELVTMKGLCNTMKLSLVCLKFLGQDWNGISWRQKWVDLESQICMEKNADSKVVHWSPCEHLWLIEPTRCWQRSLGQQLFLWSIDTMEKVPRLKNWQLTISRIFHQSRPFLIWLFSGTITR